MALFGQVQVAGGGRAAPPGARGPWLTQSTTAAIDAAWNRRRMRLGDDPRQDCLQRVQGAFGEALVAVLLGIPATASPFAEVFQPVDVPETSEQPAGGSEMLLNIQG